MKQKPRTRRITIKALRSLGACTAAITWFRAHRRDWPTEIWKNASCGVWMEWATRKRLNVAPAIHAIETLDNRRFSEMARKFPANILSNSAPCARLSNKQFHDAVSSAPLSAVLYPHACSRLTDGQFAGIIERNPYPILYCRHIFDRLTDDQLHKALRVILANNEFIPLIRSWIRPSQRQ